MPQSCAAPSHTVSAERPPRLTATQTAHYQREGYLLYHDQVFGAEKFAGLKTHFEHLLAELPADTRPEHMDVPHFFDPELFTWLLDDAVLDLVEPLIGPDIALYSSHFICKPSGDGKRVPWHEDSMYWKGTLDPMEVCTVWLAIDPSDAGNSAMRVIPGTHLGTGGYSEYDPVPDPQRSVFGTEIKPHLFDARRAVTCELAAGEASLHHAKLMHGSQANTSDRRRCGYTMRYMSTRCRFNHEQRGDSHQIYLARGRDHAGNRYGDPTKPAPELARERARLNLKGH
jgi:hypothetical protein